MIGGVTLGLGKGPRHGFIFFPPVIRPVPGKRYLTLGLVFGGDDVEADLVIAGDSSSATTSRGWKQLANSCLV